MRKKNKKQKNTVFLHSRTFFFHLKNTLLSKHFFSAFYCSFFLFCLCSGTASNERAGMNDQPISLTQAAATGFSIDEEQAFFTDPCHTPVSYSISHWGTDPFIQGAWSQLSVGGSPEDRYVLGSKISNRLILAGEACHVKYPAMVRER
jgi:hypothetical protein